MSRAYRISLRESVTKTVTAEDAAACSLDMLPILGRDEMAEHLAATLVADGFDRDGAVLTAIDGPVTITVDVTSGEVTVHVTESAEVTTQKRQTRVVSEEQTRDAGGQTALEARVKGELSASLERELNDRRTDHQDRITAELDRRLPDIRDRLDRAVNRATAEALKVKAARLGRITKIHEDQAAGQLEIVIEV